MAERDPPDGRCPPLSQIERLLDGLGWDEREDVLRHLDRCEVCQVTVAMLARSGAASTPRPSHDAASDGGRGGLAPGLVVGRYEIVGLLGAGAMGMVYEARDPQLDRNVALKVLRPELAARPDGVERLQREARAMAQLRHPNIVTIHDVATSGGLAFIAMERVEGPSLGRCLRDGNAPPERIWRFFLEAGRALAAAHEAGIVHRDFKPDNVLLDRLEVAKVADFGLALVGEPPGEARSPTRDDEHTSESEEGSRRTSRVGTPRYMAPEVMEGRPATPASDQYGYCWALAEWLVGHPLIEDATWERLLGAKRRRRFELSGIERPVRRVLLRGLEPDPGARHPGMDAVLAELARARRSWLRPVAMGSMVAATVVGLAWPGAEPCDPGESRAVAVWNPELRAALLAEPASGLAFGGESLAIVTGELDARIDAWRDVAAGVCRYAPGGDAARAIGQCLDEDLGGIAAVVQLAQGGDSPERIAETVSAAVSLPDPRRCADARADVGPAADSAKVTALRQTLARARAMTQASRFEEAHRLLGEAGAVATEVASPRFEAQVHLHRARLREAEGDVREGLEDARAAYRRAVTVQADAVALEAALLALSLSVHYGRDLDEARALADDAEAWLVRLGRPQGSEAELLLRRSSLASAEGDAVRAESLSRAAVAAFEASGADPLDVARARATLVAALAEQTRTDEAYAVQEEVRAVLVERLGAHHPDVAAALSNLARIDYLRGDFERCRERLTEVLAIQGPTLGDDSAPYASTLGLLGTVEGTLGHLEVGEGHVRRSVEIQGRRLGEKHPELASPLVNLANIQSRLGRYDEAIENYRRAAEIRETSTGPDNPRLALILSNLADALTYAGRLDEAETQARRALAIDEKTLGDHPQTAFAQSALSLIHQQSGRRAEALVHLRRAIEIRLGTLGPDHPDLISNYINLGMLEIDASNHDEAEQAFAEARRIAVAAYGDSHAEVARALHHLGLVAIARGDTRRARGWFESALELRERIQTDPIDLADTRLRLAQVLRRTGGRPARGRSRSLAAAALQTYREAGPNYAALARDAAVLSSAG